MKTLRLTTALLATMAAAVPAALSAQANAMSTVTVYPFRAASGVQWVNRDLANTIGQHASQGVVASGKLNVKDQTANAAIQAQLDAAGGLAQFNAVKPIERDKQLQSKYLLLGSVESAEATQTGYDKNRKALYSAKVNVTLEMIDVETGAIVDTRSVVLDNTFDAGQQKQCTGNFIAKKACEVAAKKLTDESQKRHGGDETAQQALSSAVDKMNDQAADFVITLASTGKIK